MSFMHICKSIDNNGIITNYEVGNWNIEPHRDTMKGFIQNFNTNVEARYILDNECGELIITLYTMQGDFSKEIPKHIQNRIISMEKQNLKKIEKIKKSY